MRNIRKKTASTDNLLAWKHWLNGDCIETALRRIELRWIKTKSNHFNQREGFTSDYSNSDQDCTRGNNVVSTLPLLLSLPIQIFNRKFNKQSRAHLLAMLPRYIGSFKKSSLASKERKRKQVAYTILLQLKIYMDISRRIS